MRYDKMKFLESVGFSDMVAKVKDGKCPICAKVVHPNAEFRDNKSRKEFTISGMCQECQDAVFTEDD